MFPKDHRVINEHVEKVYELERITGKQFGGKLYSKLKKNRRFPLLLSVRCAAIYPNQMRGVMETILVILSYIFIITFYYYPRMLVSMMILLKKYVLPLTMPGLPTHVIIVLFANSVSTCLG